MQNTGYQYKYLDDLIEMAEYASWFLLEKVDYLYDNNEGAKMLVDAILEFHGIEDASSLLESK